jgi:hypothetical protein
VFRLRSGNLRPSFGGCCASATITLSIARIRMDTAWLVDKASTSPRRSRRSGFSRGRLGIELLLCCIRAGRMTGDSGPWWIWPAMVRPSRKNERRVVFNFGLAPQRSDRSNNGEGRECCFEERATRVLHGYRFSIPAASPSMFKANARSLGAELQAHDFCQQQIELPAETASNVQVKGTRHAEIHGAH